MPVTQTQYNAAVAYNAAIRYDGAVTTADIATGNRHSAIWRPQRGRSHIFRSIPSLPTFSGIATRAETKPILPVEIPVSKAIQDVILAPTREAAKAEILDFVKNKELRQQAQPVLPDTVATQPSYITPPQLEPEVMGAQAQRRREEAARKRLADDDSEVMELVSLLEAF